MTERGSGSKPRSYRIDIDRSLLGRQSAARREAHMKRRCERTVRFEPRDKREDLFDAAPTRARKDDHIGRSAVGQKILNLLWAGRHAGCAPKDSGDELENIFECASDCLSRSP